MAVVIKNPAITINSVNLTGDISEVTLTQSYPEVTTTAFGDLGVRRMKGLEDSSIAITFYQDYAANKLHAAIGGIVGSAVAFSVKPGTASTSATNPQFSGTAYIAEYMPAAWTVGEVAQVSVTWPVDGQIDVATS